MAYRTQHLKDEQWAVINNDEKPLFTGTLRECEDWFDQKENLSRKQVSLIEKLTRKLRNLFGRSDQASDSDQISRVEESSRKEPEGLMASQDAEEDKSSRTQQK